MAEETVGKDKRVLPVKEGKALTAANAAVGGMGIISSYNVCHSLCMGIIAVLSVFGIFITGMPLFFLTKYQLYFWTFGIIILAVAVGLYFWKGPCISKKMIAANGGLLLAGFPFARGYEFIFMVIGFGIVLIIVLMYLFERFGNGKK
ncbi:MAG: hypothetical protein HY438_03105 [DPANN group archaeon]|nr:hypothetical protein [DPANN group archaeon]